VRVHRIVKPDGAVVLFEDGPVPRAGECVRLSGEPFEVARVEWTARGVDECGDADELLRASVFVRPYDALDAEKGTET
jgi:hypothetical protein